MRKIGEVGEDESELLAATKPDEDFVVSQEDIASKRGNYVFTVGNVSSGKSCLQNMIVHRLMKRSDIDLGYANKDGDHVHDSILNDWITRIDRGELPVRTRQNRLQEFSFKFTPEKKKSLKINFIELSGEDIKSIIPSSTKGDSPSLNENLTLYLKSNASSIKKRFIFVADATREFPDHELSDDLSEDILFNTLIKHLLSKQIGLHKIQVLFLVSKWDTVKSQYKNARQFVRKNFPQTTRVLRSDRCNVTYGPYSVGDVTIDKITQEPKITRLDSIYTDMVLQWIYQTYTGKVLPNTRKVKRTLIDRFKGLF